MKIDYTKNIMLHIEVQNKPDEWRLGQAYFNYAYSHVPKEVDKIRGTDQDCFYEDNKIPEFLKALNKLLLTKNIK